MDLEIQQRVKDTAEKVGAENLVVILGGAEAESAGLSAETVTAGDPTYAGPLAGVELGSSCFLKSVTSTRYQVLALHSLGSFLAMT